jgi:hypothetical protein
MAFTTIPTATLHLYYFYGSAANNVNNKNALDMDSVT